MARQTAMRTGPRTVTKPTGGTLRREQAAEIAAGLARGIGGGVRTGGPSAKAPLQRLSPGVYRDAEGRLTNSAGRLRRPERAQPDYRFDEGGAPGRMGEALGEALPKPGPRRPAPLGTQPGTPTDQIRPGAPLGEFAGSQNGLDPSILELARRRAETIRSGGIVTADYNAQRDRLVNEMLQRQQGPYDRSIPRIPELQQPMPNQLPPSAPMMPPQGPNPSRSFDTNLLNTYLQGPQAPGMPMGQQQTFDPNKPPAPGMQVNYNMLGQPYWAYGKMIS